MTDLLKHIEASIDDRALLRRGAPIMVAVSGGVDSMVLLHLLHWLAPEHRWRLVVVHFNHQLRGRSSDADERLVVRAAHALGLRVTVGRGDVRSLARRRGWSVEMAAREMRHAYFARSAARLKIQVAALAHHADDQVELFFLRLLRGSGGDGLTGMKWTSVSPARQIGRRHKFRLVRPLLDVPKAALENFARQHGIAFREDASNASLDVQRNRIRRELLPMLRRHYQPALNKTILRAIELVGAEAEFAIEAARRWLRSPSAAPFDALSVAVQRRCLQHQLFAAGNVGDFELVERLRLRVDESTSMNPRLAASRNRAGKVRFIKIQPSSAAKLFAGRKIAWIDLRKAAGKTEFAGNTICFEIQPAKGVTRPRPSPAREFFDAAKVGMRIGFRHWQAGDRFQPIGMERAVKLQDLFTNGKLPREVRHRLVVAVTVQGVIFWVEGLRIGERFKLDKRTRQRLKWTWQRL